LLALGIIIFTGRVVDTPTCVDNNKNYSLKGTCSLTGFSRTDSCYINGMLRKWSCTEGTCSSCKEGGCYYEDINCSQIYGPNYICSDGACVKGEDISCTDSDNGDNIYVQGVTQMIPTREGYPNNFTDKCENGYLQEGVCNELKVVNVVTHTCPTGYGCENGACIINFTCISVGETCSSNNLCCPGLSCINNKCAEVCSVKKTSSNFCEIKSSNKVMVGTQLLQLSYDTGTSKCIFKTETGNLVSISWTSENTGRVSVNNEIYSISQIKNSSISPNECFIIISSNPSCVNEGEICSAYPCCSSELSCINNLCQKNQTSQQNNYTLSNSNITFSTTQGAIDSVPPSISSEQAIEYNTELGRAQIDSITLDVESGKLVYLISGVKEGKFFAIIPVSAEIQQKIDANSGDILSTEKPWWSFLASGI
jgi:uncharacterized membrane protein YkoI